MSGNKNTPLPDNEHVKALSDILRENKIDIRELLGIIGCVTAMEREMSKAAADLSAVRKELAEMREEKDHPIGVALRSAVRESAAKINTVRSGIKVLKDKIISGCKRAAHAFKTGGVSALNNLADFLDIRRDLENTRNAVNDAIRCNEKRIAKIESLSEEFHAAGRGLKNIGRVMTGKEPIRDIRPNGTLARLAEFPFRSEIGRLNRVLNRTGKALAGLDRLEKAAANRTEKDRPSAIEEMERMKPAVERRKKETPAKGAEKRTGIAV
jgi:predicted nuclease with TOPRIM domain